MDAKRRNSSTARGDLGRGSGARRRFWSLRVVMSEDALPRRRVELLCSRSDLIINARQEIFGGRWDD